MKSVGSSPEKNPRSATDLYNYFIDFYNYKSHEWSWWEHHRKKYTIEQYENIPTAFAAFAVWALYIN